MLTHEQIKKMSSQELDQKISDILGKLLTPYSKNWRDAGSLLDILAAKNATIDIVRNNGWAVRIEMTGDINDDIYFKTTAYGNAPEAIARCFLEWWDATHQAQP